MQKIIAIARTDSTTAKCALPKDAVISSITCYQAVAAGTNAATWTVGWTGATTAVLNAFSAGTTSVGLIHPGLAAGTAVFTKLDSDKQVFATFGGTSVSGGTGFVVIDYFIAGPGESVDD
jgi:hypothetical protein